MRTCILRLLGDAKDSSTCFVDGFDDLSVKYTKYTKYQHRPDPIAAERSASVNTPDVSPSTERLF
jgi:hypothetical protein